MIVKATDNPNRSGSTQVAGVILGVLAAAICIWRLRYMHEPLENDITIRMAYAARAVAGARYYSDLFVFGPPGSLWINEFFFWLFGANDISVTIMGCVFSVLTLFGVYRCTRLLTDVRSGLIAAGTWTLVNADLFTQANQPNTEVITIAALVWGFAILFDPRTAQSLWRLVAAGLLFFLASTVKHFLAITPLLAAILSIVTPAKGSSGTGEEFDKEALRSWAVVGVTALAAWAVLLGWYGATGRLAAFIAALFGLSVEYATQLHGFLSNFLLGVQPFRLLPPHQLPFVLLYGLLFAALLRGLLGTPDRRWRLVLGWVLGTWFSVSASGRFYAHYYMLWLPLISIGTGAMFGLAQTFSRRQLALGLRAGIALAVIVVGIRQLSQLVQYDADKAVVAKYGYQGQVFREIRILGKRLAESLPAASSVFEIGAHGFYFYAARPAPGPFVDSIYGIDTAFPREYREAMLPQLLQSPPEVLVVRRSVFGSNSDLALRQILADLLKDVEYVEDKTNKYNHLLVLSRLHPEARNAGKD